MLITSPEVYKFLEVNVPLFDAVGTDKKGRAEKEEGIGGGTYEVVLPAALGEGNLLPTFEKQQDDPGKSIDSGCCLFCFYARHM